MPEKTLPTKIGFLTKGYVFYPFSFMDRIKVLFGYRAVLQNNLASQHNPGKTQIVSRFILTPLTEGPKAIQAIEAEDARIHAERVKKMETAAAAKSKSGLGAEVDRTANDPKHEEPQK